MFFFFVIWTPQGTKRGTYVRGTRGPLRACHESDTGRSCIAAHAPNAEHVPHSHWRSRRPRTWRPVRIVCKPY